MMHDIRFRSSMLLAALAIAGALSQPLLAQQPALNTLTAAEKKAGWKLLFDGKTTTGWKGYKSDTMPSAWKIVDGVLTKASSTDDIMPKQQFKNFELQVDWMLGTGGNSGIFYRASEEYDHIYWTGPEFQLLDDANAPDGKSPLTAAGAAYGLYPAPADIVKPANQWNTARIIVNGTHVEHWQNGKKLLEYTLGSPDWEAKVKASKFNAWAHYGRLEKGYIGFQGDHDGVLSLRNIKIRELP